MQQPALTTPIQCRARRGFTIVELLIVIVVIAILAAIVVVSYNGVTKRAVEVSMKSDLQGAASALELDRRHKNSYPLAATDANGGEGLPTSDGNVLDYTPRSYGYCVSVSNPRTTMTYHLKSTDANRIEVGVCVGVVVTLAGSSSTGSADGAGATARFGLYSPTDVAVDASGTLYVADRYNHRIRKITPAGVTTTLAGSTIGFVDGTGTAAKFNSPIGIAVDSAGFVYVSENLGNRIRKISPTGVVTTLAGSGTAGYADGVGVEAQFREPNGIAVDSAGYLYVADSNNYRIRKITPTGTVTTLAGSTSGYIDGTGTEARFNNPKGVAVDSAGVVYVADYIHRIRKISPTGVVTTLAGSGTAGNADGVGVEAQFNYPTGVAVDALGMVYVADSYNHRIRKISPTGVVTTLAGSGTSGFLDGSTTEARLNRPSGVIVDSSGNVYVADSFNQRIRKIEE